MSGRGSGRRKRPFGVTVLAILQTVSGIQLLFQAIVLLAVASMINDPEARENISAFADENLADTLVLVLTLLGIVFLVIAILSFHLARGYLNGHEWARRRGRKVAMFAILFAFISLILMPTVANPGAPVWTILFNVFILVYLNRRRVRSFFR